MSDRDGIVMEAPSRASAWTLGATLMAAPIAWLCGVPIVPIVLVTVVATMMQTRPTKLLFRADALNERWFFLRTRIGWADLVRFSLDDRGLLLSLRSGRRHRIHVRGDAIPHARVLRDGIAHMISQCAGIHPDSGPILRIGDREVAPFELAEMSPALMTALETAKRVAKMRGADSVEPIDFVHALLVGPERSMLATFGLDLSAMNVDRKADAYRGELVDGLSPTFEIATRRARLASANRKRQLDPIDLLLELIRTGDAAAEGLVARGLVPMRMVDHRAHGLSPAQSDARSRKTLAASELLAGVDTPRVSLVFVDDDFTPFVVVARLVEKHLDLGPAEANAFARRVNDEKRARHGSYEAEKGAALAIELMYEARRQGAPLVVELAADRTERRWNSEKSGPDRKSRVHVSIPGRSVRRLGGDWISAPQERE